MRPSRILAAVVFRSLNDSEDNLARPCHEMAAGTHNLSLTTVAICFPAH